MHLDQDQGRRHGWGLVRPVSTLKWPLGSGHWQPVGLGYSTGTPIDPIALRHERSQGAKAYWPPLSGRESAASGALFSGPAGRRTYRLDQVMSGSCK